ncbi:sulfite exporter TauE/SafE family protein [Chloroflexia bacterium SDU3-3]|nr:sulfite exporter TauE/SafE family protein [Chloroflexia bacterium SDU3-3]
MAMELWQWALAALAAFIVGMSKTGVTGLGILAVALFASIIPARESVGVMLIVLIAGDVVAVAAYRREADWPQLLRLFPWAAAGVVIGAVALGRIDDTLMKRLIGVTLVTLVGMVLLRRRSPAAPDAPPRRWVGPLAGLFGGITTMIANAAGPIMAIYLLAMRLPKMVFIGTTAWFFLVLNLFKVPFSVGLGMVNMGSLQVSLALAPFAVAGALVGRWLIRFINQELFENLALGLAVLAGVRMLL